LFQILALDDHELQWVCSHLGHTADVHKLHYRATSGFIERINIAKLSLLQDFNVVGKFAGKKLQDLSVEGSSLFSTNRKTTSLV